MPIASETPLSTLTFNDVCIGLELPPLVVEVTPSLVIAGALANRDPQDVHHDHALARQRGFEDIFMNNMTSMGLVCRFVSDWAGPEAIVEHFAFRLHRPQYPRGELRFSGRVAAKHQLRERGCITINVVGANDLGDHIICTVRLSLLLASKDDP